MCGICGIAGWSDPDLVSRMRDTMTHRGPDGKGLYSSDLVTLGHRRLSVIDLESGQQPMTNEDESIWVVFNGEIYNHDDLRTGLEARGHRFRSRSDTEVILHLYEEKGRECVDDLRGMFAFGLWDQRRQQLFLARDRLGIKPLYYLVFGGCLLFASEIKAILEWDRYTPSVDLEALDHHLATRFGPDRKTIFRDILRLRPGERLTWKDGSVSRDIYWQLPAHDELGQTDSEEVRDNVRAMLRESVSMRLMSDVPRGVYLSGGVDSSLIASLANESAGEKTTTLSVRFDDARFDESGLARQTARELGVDHVTVDAAASDADSLARVLWHMEEPVADATCIPMYRLAQATKPVATVVLGGEGADELFAGYPKYIFYHRFHRRFPKWGKRFCAGLAPIAGFLGGADRLRDYLRDADPDYHSFSRLVSVWSEKERNGLYSKAVSQEVPEFPTADSDLNEILRTDLRTWLPNDLLLKCDKMAMAHGVELRVPFLDHPLVEFCQTIPESLKLRRFAAKWILRKAAEGLLPGNTVRRKKRGFSVPMEKWFGESGFANGVLNKKTIEEQGFFQWPRVEEELSRGWRRLFPRRRLFSILVFTLWHKIFIEKSVKITDPMPAHGAVSPPKVSVG